MKRIVIGAVLCSALAFVVRPTFALVVPDVVVPGNLETTGNVNAGTLSGDGSAITGLSGANITSGPIDQTYIDPAVTRDAELAQHNADPNAHNGGGRVPIETNPASYCDGTNDGVMWLESTDGNLRACAGLNTVRVFGGSTELHVTGHVLFGTGTGIDGNLGGLSGADGICASAVALVSPWNALPTTWTAVLSTSTVDARDRVSISGPVYNTNGDLLANDANDLWDTEIADTVRDLGGTEIPNTSIMFPFGSVEQFVLTGTIGIGTKTAQTCVDWTSSDGAQLGSVGLPASTDISWMNSASIYCDNPGGLFHLYIYCVSDTEVSWTAVRDTFP